MNSAQPLLVLFNTETTRIALASNDFLFSPIRSSLPFCSFQPLVLLLLMSNDSNLPYPHPCIKSSTGFNLLPFLPFFSPFIVVDVHGIRPTAPSSSCHVPVLSFPAIPLLSCANPPIRHIPSKMGFGYLFCHVFPIDHVSIFPYLFLQFVYRAFKIRLLCS